MLILKETLILSAFPVVFHPPIIKVPQNQSNQGVEIMNQMTFSDMEFSGRKRVTQKEKFLR